MGIFPGQDHWTKKQSWQSVKFNVMWMSRDISDYLSNRQLNNKIASINGRRLLERYRYNSFDRVENGNGLFGILEEAKLGAFPMTEKTKSIDYMKNVLMYLENPRRHKRPYSLYFKKTQSFFEKLYEELSLSS